MTEQPLVDQSVDVLAGRILADIVSTGTREAARRLAETHPLHAISSHQDEHEEPVEQTH